MPVVPLCDCCAIVHRMRPRADRAAAAPTHALACSPGDTVPSRLARRVRGERSRCQREERAFLARVEITLRRTGPKGVIWQQRAWPATGFDMFYDPATGEYGVND